MYGNEQVKKTVESMKEVSEPILKSKAKSIKFLYEAGLMSKEEMEIKLKEIKMNKISVDYVKNVNIESGCIIIDKGYGNVFMMTNKNTYVELCSGHIYEESDIVISQVLGRDINIKIET